MGYRENILLIKIMTSNLFVSVNSNLLLIYKFWGDHRLPRYGYLKMYVFYLEWIERSLAYQETHNQVIIQ